MELRREGKIKYVWSYNGTVHYKTVDDHNIPGTKVFHISELEDKFNVQGLQNRSLNRSGNNG